MPSDLAQRRQTHFVLWRPAHPDPPPRLVIGTLQPGNPPTFAGRRDFDLSPVPGVPDLFVRAASACQLCDGQVYHYWFEVNDSDPDRIPKQPILVTDPAASIVDWRLRSPQPPAPYNDDDRHPAGVVKFVAGQLLPCDPGGETPDYTGDTPLARRPTNNRLVIYELPTSWARRGENGGVEIDVGTFRDVQALVEREAEPANFADLDTLQVGRAYLQDLGINALELLPPADSFVQREWGYATSNYFAADFDLGFPEGHRSPTATTDLVQLVSACHRQGIRFFCDMVMAFATHYAYQNVNYLDFHVQPNTGDPEEYNQGQKREAFGGKLFKYNYFPPDPTYDPVTGALRRLCPARQLMKAYLQRWLEDFRVDGLRLDSIVNVGNWDFVQEFKDLARQLWRDRWTAAAGSPEGAEARFLVVGEELAVPLGLITQQRLDGLWNETFLYRVRAAILGENHSSDPDFETTIRTLIDCRRLGFTDGTQAINYVTSHDVEGFRKERLKLFLTHNNIHSTEQIARRIQLAFVCLLTAVGVPMFLAGEEFADEHDKATVFPQKQTDPVNYDRLQDPWRQSLFAYVARLVKFRTSADALAVNDTDFMHVDFTPGRRVLVWQRGQPATGNLVVVVANFSDFGTDNPTDPRSEYRIPRWPAAPAGKRWREVSQDRDVPLEWAGREPLYPWEAKVYALV